jgi:hypothetical protein
MIPRIATDSLPLSLVIAGALSFQALGMRQGAEAGVLVAGTALAVMGIGLGSRIPGVMIGLLLMLVPLQTPVLAGLYRLGAPQPVVRGLGFTKEVAIASLVVAAIASHGRGRRSTTWFLALAYVVLVSAFVVGPMLAPGVLEEFPLGVRLLAWRSECLGVVALLALAALRLPPRTLSRCADMVVLAGLVLGCGAIWEMTSPETFDTFGQNVLRVPSFRQDILGADPSLGNALIHYTSQAGGRSLRAGSFLYDPLNLGFYLLIPFAILCARLADKARARDGLSVLIVSGALLGTATRSTAVAAVAAALAVVLLARGMARARAATAIAALAVPVVWTVGGALLRRVSDAQVGRDVSAQEHLARSGAALKAVLSNPLGHGLGVSPGAGITRPVQGALIAENAYLAVGLATGVLGMLLFTGLLITSIGRVARARPGSVASQGLAAAGVGLAVSGLFLHTWLPFAVSLTYWPLVGIALGQQESLRQRESELIDVGDLEAVE